MVELPETRGARLVLVLAAAVTLAGGLYFRLAGATTHPLWLDEAYSAYAAAGGWRFLWTVVPQYETHPPFYYSLVRLWTLGFGDSLGALRALGITASVATVPVMVLAGREIVRLVRPRTGAWMVPAVVLLLVALSPYPLSMAHQVRPYPLMILVYAVVCLALLRIARVTAAGGAIPLRAFLAYLAALALMLWLHNMGPLYGLALGLALLVLVLRRTLTRRDWLLLVGGHVAVALVYLPGFLILVDQAPTWVKSTWLSFDSAALRRRLSNLYLVTADSGAVAGLVLALIGLFRLARVAAGRRLAAGLLLLGVLPVLLSILLSIYVAPVFLERTMAACVMPMLLLMAAAFAGGRWLRWPALLALMLLAVWMVDSDRKRFPGRPSQDWYPAVRWLHARFRTGDIVLAYPNEGALPFAYAVRDMAVDMPYRPIPTAVPSLGFTDGWHPTGSRGVVSLPRPHLRAIAQAPENRAAPTVWLLRLGAGAYDPGDMFLDELSRGRVRVDRYRREPIDIIGLRRADLPPAR